eukprot:654199_1
MDAAVMMRCQVSKDEVVNEDEHMRTINTIQDRVRMAVQETDTRIDIVTTNRWIMHRVEQAEEVGVEIERETIIERVNTTRTAENETADIEEAMAAVEKVIVAEDAYAEETEDIVVAAVDTVEEMQKNIK